MARDLAAEAAGGRPATLSSYLTRCQSWAEGLQRDAGGNIPNGLSAVLRDLVAWYGTPAVLSMLAVESEREYAGMDADFMAVSQDLAAMVSKAVATMPEAAK